MAVLANTITEAGVMPSLCLGSTLLYEDMTPQEKDAGLAVCEKWLPSRDSSQRREARLGAGL
jgi:hypothetical protein